MQEAEWWLTWRGLRARAAGRRIVFWGRSEEWVPKCLGKLDQDLAYIIDINPKFQGTEYLGLRVEPPETLFQDDRNDVYVIITTSVFDGVVQELLRQGYVAGREFSCCPEYYDFHILESMRRYQQSVIVSCSDYLNQANPRSSQDGGGLFRYQIGINECELLQKGQFRQIEQVGDYFFAVEYVDMQLVILDRNFDVIERRPLDQPNYCGLAYDPKRNVLILANATTDCLYLFEKDSFKLLETAPFSDKCEMDAKSPHHLNDVCVDGDFVYASYFSYGGAWRKGQYDGGVAEFQLDRMSQGPRPVANGLWSPHSPKIIDGNLCYLDSMRGRLHVNSQISAVAFPGFARGLAFDGNFYYVGLSEDMYISRAFAIRDSIMLNAGFFMVDVQTKASRFYPMLRNMNIHDLLIVDTDLVG